MDRNENGSEVDKQEVFTVPELARFLRISKSTVYRLIHAGEIPYMRVGGRLYRFYRDVIDEWCWEMTFMPGTSALRKQSETVMGRPKQIWKSTIQA